MQEPNDAVIRVDHLSKVFKLPHEKSGSVKSAFVNFYRRKKGYELQQALKDISFEVKKGEFFGIVGRNGSGKSTLLKLLAGIYVPTKGDIQVEGKLTPFIELGVGFNMELTGRENIYLNGALLGFNRKEMRKMYKDIVEFAELEKFMDQKLKNYSSGMQVRLAFSIAIRVQSDILLIDEVLAVGDTSFQRKCFDVFEKHKADNRTVILVTHDMSSIRQFCDRALLINDGEFIDIGKPSKIAAEYEEINQENVDKDTKQSNTLKERTSKIKATLLDKDNKPAVSFNRGAKLKVLIEWQGKLPVKNIGTAILKQSGEFIFGSNTMGDNGVRPSKNDNKFYWEVNLNLGPGRYSLMYGIFGETSYDVLDFVSQGPSFTVIADKGRDWEGMLYLENEWHKRS